MSALLTVAEWATALFLVGGALISFTGALGLARLRDFYERVHASTLCSSLGMSGVVAASILYFSVTGGRLLIHELLIGIFVTLTTPVTLMMLARAAHLRSLPKPTANPAATAAPSDNTSPQRDDPR